MRTIVEHLISEALKNIDGISTIPDFQIEVPKDRSHGDLAANIAMLLSKQLREPPRTIAQHLLDIIDYDPTIIEKAEIAGPGFINFTFTHAFWVKQLKSIITDAVIFGQTELFEGKKVIVEFVSANPTGPLTVGHGRNAVLGDTLSRLYEWNGATVYREYYFNNAGRQMRVLGESVKARYMHIINREYPFPEDGYEGEYIVEIAQSIYDEHGDTWAENDYSLFKKQAEKMIFMDIESTLQRMSIQMDGYFNEDNLYQNGSIDQAVDTLRKKELAYDKDGATWFKTTIFGKETDTVLIKSTGEPTYRLPDIAYHITKLERGFDICLDILGADHIATYPDVISGIKALGYDTVKIDVLIYQFVTLLKDGKPFKMSTRKANFVTLDELMDEVGEDVTRFFFLMRSPGTHLEFDITAAKEASEKNPVFYLQYANARICSIIRKAKEMYDLSKPADLSNLRDNPEIGLIKTLIEFPNVVESACKTKEPHKIINYMEDVAHDFTHFYHHCKVLGEDAELSLSRIRLLEATSQILKNGLSILGISAPESM